MYKQHYNPRICYSFQAEEENYIASQKESTTPIIKIKKPGLKVVISSSTNSTFYEEDDEELLQTPQDHEEVKQPSSPGYSNFYIKLPNGKWMVRIRDANRKIINTYEVDCSMV